jgi:hypothetical protein
MYYTKSVNGLPAIQRDGRGVLSVWGQDWEFANWLCELLNELNDTPKLLLNEQDWNGSRRWTMLSVGRCSLPDLQSTAVFHCVSFITSTDRHFLEMSKHMMQPQTQLGQIKFDRRTLSLSFREQIAQLPD